MKEMGWLDAVDGKPKRFANPYYLEGYEQGLKDLK